MSIRGPPPSKVGSGGNSLLSEAGADEEAATAEFWLATDGRYRIGPTRGAWTKPAAEYIGGAAREAARRQRLAAIETELAELATREERIAAELMALDRERAALNAPRTHV